MQWTQCTEGVNGETCSRDGALKGLTVDHVEIVILLTPPAYSGEARCNSSTLPLPSPTFLCIQVKLLAWDLVDIIKSVLVQPLWWKWSLKFMIFLCCYQKFNL